MGYRVLYSGEDTLHVKLLLLHTPDLTSLAHRGCGLFEGYPKDTEGRYNLTELSIALL